MKKLLLTLLSTIVILGCNDDDNPPPPAEVSAPVVSGIEVMDITRVADGLGMQITFNRVGDESLISEYRVFVVKSSAQAAFDLAKAESVSTGNYTKREADGTNKVITLDESSTDSDGAALAESTPYVVFVLSVADGVKATINALSSVSSIITLNFPVAQPVLNLNLLDVANSGTSADLEINFDLSDPSNIDELRIFIMEKDESGSFDLATAESISSSKYVSLAPTKNKLKLSENVFDISENPITEGVEYVTFILSVSEESLGIDNSLSEVSESVILQQITVVRTVTDFINSGSGGISADIDGNVYMGNFGTTLSGGGTEVFLITPEGEVSVFVSGMNGAAGNEFDSEGNLYQANITGGTISKITPDGQVSSFASGISSPIGLAFDSKGDLFVSACNGNIWKIAPDGTKSIFSSSSLLQCPNGLDLDDADNVYTSNFDNGQIIKITPDGSASVFATHPGNNNAHLIFKDDIFYVAARAANQIYTMDLDGNTSLFAGTGIRGLQDGPLSSATISRTNDFAFSPDGKKLYFNDKDPLAVGSVISPVVIRVIEFAN